MSLHTIQKILKSREIEVLELIAVGHTAKECAHEMHVSEATVKQYLTVIYRVLRVNDWGDPRVRAVLWYRDELANGQEQTKSSDADSGPSESAQSIPSSDRR